ncbi:hypothetical protein TrST_g4235 [Triparma strigata]|uniref:Tubby C-terminal domain-containing protein n=1 Tax=Triparma strigata TaxID=1606541 RepID=A0A9W6ZGH0_9STRA|nr:hypothetical protein TrST_g4235 [Triparma strigata]
MAPNPFVDPPVPHPLLPFIIALFLPPSFTFLLLKPCPPSRSHNIYNLSFACLYDDSLKLLSEVYKHLLKQNEVKPKGIIEKSWDAFCDRYDHIWINAVGWALAKYIYAVEMFKITIDDRYPSMARFLKIPPPGKAGFLRPIVQAMNESDSNSKRRFHLRPMFDQCLEHLPHLFLLRPIPVKPGTNSLVNLNLWLTCVILLYRRVNVWYTAAICFCTLISFYNMRIVDYKKEPRGGLSPKSPLNKLLDLWDFMSKPMEHQSLDHMIGGECHISVLSKLKLSDIPKYDLINPSGQRETFYPYICPDGYHNGLTGDDSLSEQFTDANPKSSDDVKKRQAIGKIKNEWNLGITRHNVLPWTLLTSFLCFWFSLSFEGVPVFSDDGDAIEDYIHIPKHMIPLLKEGYGFFMLFMLALNLASPSVINWSVLGYFSAVGLNCSKFNRGTYLNPFFEVSDNLVSGFLAKISYQYVTISPRVALPLSNLITYGMWVPLIVGVVLELSDVRLFKKAAFRNKVNVDTGLPLTPDDVYEIKSRVVEDAMDEWYSINGSKFFWRAETRLGEEICQTNDGEKIKNYLLGYVKFHTSRCMSCLVSISKEIGRESDRRWEASDPVFDLVDFPTKGIDGRKYIEKKNCLKHFKNYSYGRSIFLPQSKWKEHVVLRPVSDPAESTFIVRSDGNGDCFGLIAVKRGGVFYISNHRFFGDWCKGRDVIDKFYFAKLTINGPDFKLVVDESYIERYWRQDVKGVHCSDNDDDAEGDKKKDAADEEKAVLEDFDKDEFKWMGKEWTILSGSHTSVKLQDCKAEVRNIVFNIVNLGRSPVAAGGSMVIPSSKEEEMLETKNKQPTWNPKLKSLILKFNQQRVKIASPKNFLLECDAMGGKEVMQFGKRGGGLYALDFCAPMGLLQAFGSCLVAFEWQDEEVSDDES